MAVSTGSILTACKKPDEASKGSDGGKGSASEVIKVGEFASLTGKEATFGQSSHKGTLLAIEELNAAGGVLGRKFDLITEDLDIRIFVIDRLGGDFRLSAQQSRHKNRAAFGAEYRIFLKIVEFCGAALTVPLCSKFGFGHGVPLFDDRAGVSRVCVRCQTENAFYA